MYRAYCDDYLLYDPSAGVTLGSPSLSLELGKTGSFDFDIYPGHPLFGTLRKLKSIITVYDDSRMVFRGRVLSDDEGFHNERSVSCEGELAFLFDSIVRPYDYSGTVEGLLSKLIESHNEQVDSTRRFTLGNVTVGEGVTVSASSKDYPTTWDELSKKLTNIYGGYLYVRHEGGASYLDYIEDFTALGSQPVVFGRNLLDFGRSVSGEDLATAVIPLGKNSSSGEPLTIASVNNGRDYIVDQEAMDLYGFIAKTQTWKDVDDPATLKANAEGYLAQVKGLTVSIELSAVDLSSLESDISSFSLGTYVRVESDPHDVEGEFLVSKMSVGLDDPASTKLTLGTTYQTLTEKTGVVSPEAILVLQRDVVGNSSSVSEVNRRIDDIVSNGLPQKDPIAPELQNGWTNHDGFSPARYWKDSLGIVHLYGLIEGGSTAKSTKLFTLPEGYRPSARELFPSLSAGFVARIDVDPGGTVKLGQDANSSYLTLSGISFLAAKEK